MTRKRIQAITLAGALLAVPIFLRADVSGTPTIPVGQQLNLETGAVAASGGDLAWNGSTLTPQGGATAFSSSLLPVSLYDSIDATQLAAFSQLFSTAAISVPSPASQQLVGIKDKAGHYAKLLVTGGTAGGSITVKFTTFGATSGGGGGTTGGPNIASVQNNYGLVSPGLPNYGLAPGTLFFVQGSGLANTTTDLLSSADPGLKTSVNNVTVSVTVGGTKLDCPIYYLSPTQVDAVLPGNTPLGTGTITVTNNGTVSSTFSVPIVQSAFGVLFYNGTLAAAYDTNYALLSSTNAANPGQAIVLWGSGVGADTQNDDRLFPQKQNNLTSIPMQAYVGGVQADIAYRGRSQYPGVDQVVLTIPAGAPTGCYVSLAIVSGNIVSNSVTLPIAASGKTCSDAGATYPPDVIAGLAGKTTIREGIVTVGQTTTITAGGSRTDNIVGGVFSSVTGVSTSAAANQVSIGSCLVYTNTSGGTSSGSSTGLDAGSAINVTGPSGNLSLSALSFPGSANSGIYGSLSVPANFVPAGGGSFTFNNGSGGADVKGFNVSLNLPPALVWSNAASISSVTRSQGVNVTWTGGGSGTFVQITGGSSASANGKTTSVTFVCQAPQSAGQFTVPVPVLLALPASSNGSLSVGDYSNFTFFNATGLDLGVALGSSTTSKTVAYN